MHHSLMSSLELKIPPPVVIGLACVFNWLMTDFFSILFQPSYVLIMALVVIAGIFGVSGVLGCVRNQTTVHPWNPKETNFLVTDGIFRFSRNPMYLGLIALLTAYYCYQPIMVSPIGLLFVVWFLTRFQIIPEERILSQKFGESYLSYTQRVRRWL